MAQVQAQAQAQASDAYRLQVGHNYVNDTHFLPYQKKTKNYLNYYSSSFRVDFDIIRLSLIQTNYLLIINKLSKQFLN